MVKKISLLIKNFRNHDNVDKTLKNRYHDYGRIK